MLSDNFGPERTVWEFNVGSITARLKICEEYGYRYDGDDEDGETQDALDRGEYIAFASAVEIERNGHVIGTDNLFGSVYRQGDEAEFWTAHRSPDPMNRNCSLMRAARGANVCIGHYFPDMVAQALADARVTLAQREAA